MKHTLETLRKNFSQEELNELEKELREKCVHYLNESNNDHNPDMEREVAAQVAYTLREILGDEV